MSQNGKGDRPRNNFSDEFRSNFDSIDWSKRTWCYYYNLTLGVWEAAELKDSEIHELRGRTRVYKMYSKEKAEERAALANKNNE